jgi:hypothetical protein
MDYAGSASIKDGSVRTDYQWNIERLTSELRQEAETGQITWSEAAAEANRVRNETMELMRERSSAVGRAWAESIKAEGKTLISAAGARPGTNGRTPAVRLDP